MSNAIVLGRAPERRTGRPSRRSVPTVAEVLTILGLAWLTLSRPEILALVAAAGIAAGIIAWAASRPIRAVVVLLVLVPLQVPLLALIYDLGTPAGLVRQAGFVKELLLIGVAVAALREGARQRHDLDGADRAILAFLALVTVYAVVPTLLDPFVEMFPSAPSDWYSKVLALRTDAAFLVLLLAVRSLPHLTTGTRRRLLTVTLAVGATIAIGGIVEFVDTPYWERFERTVLHLPAYREQVLDLPGQPAVVKSVILGREFTRAGSVLGHISLGFFLLPALSIALVRAARRPSLGSALAAGLSGAGVIVTLTRSAVLGAAVLIGVVAWRYPRDRTGGKVRAAMVGVLALMSVIALAEPTGLTDRTIAALTGDDPSAEGHGEATSGSLELALDHPLGLGLGFQPTVGQRTETETVVSENTYLQIANELGLLAGALFAFVLWRLYRVLARRGDALATGAAGVVAGLAIGGLFIHPWPSIATSWTLAILVGLALPRVPTTISARHRVRPAGRARGWPSTSTDP